MKTFRIEIKEYLSRIIEVNCDTIDSALVQAKELYQNEEIVLDYNDHVTTEFEEYKDE